MWRQLFSAVRVSNDPHSIRLSPRGGDNVVLKDNQIHPITLKRVIVTPAVYPRLIELEWYKSILDVLQR
jgi:hypothetical protein